MFHSAGYFRGVLCPFYEHGLCHRPHCHYRHSKPAPKSVKKLPKLRSRLVAPLQKEPLPANAKSSDKPTSDANSEKELLKSQDGPPKPDKPVSSASPTGQTGSTGTKEEISGGAKVSEEVVSEVSKVIGEIASFYGSGLDPSNTGNTGTDTNNNNGDKTGHPTDDIVITSPPEVSSEQITVTMATNTTTVSSLPSYAPENCASAVVEPNYQTPKEPIAAKCEDKTSAHSLSDTTELTDVAPSSVSEESVEVAMLHSMLVTEKDIFGDSNEMSDDGESGEDNDIHGDDVAMEMEVLSAKELASIEAEFKKVTALPSGDTSEDKTERNPQKSSNYIDVSVKKKWRAHTNAEVAVMREPVKLHTTHSVSSSFGANLDKSAIYMGKKRLAKPSEETPAAKRPKLQLTPNAKIPTKIRQRFLDSFIDEFLKTNPHPEQAYEKALNEEKVLFDRCSSRMIYMNVTTLALKRIRNQTAAQLEEMKKKSNARVEALRQSKEDGDESKTDKGHVATATPRPFSLSGKESNHHGSGGGREGERKRSKMKTSGSKPTTAVEKKKKGWQSLEAELQAAFSSETSLTSVMSSSSTGLSSSMTTMATLTSPAGSSLTSSTRLSSSASDKTGVTSPDPQASAVFSSSQFYSKKTQKPSTLIGEGAEVHSAKLKVKSKKSHSKIKQPLKTTSNVTKSDQSQSTSPTAATTPSSQELVSQKVAKTDQLRTKASTSSNTVKLVSGEQDGSKVAKTDHPQSLSSPKDLRVVCSRVTKPDPLQAISSTTATLVKPASRELTSPKLLARMDQLHVQVKAFSTAIDRPSSREVAGSRMVNKSKSKDRNLPKKARHSKDGAPSTHRSSTELTHQDCISEPKEVPKKRKSSSLASSPSKTSSSSSASAPQNPLHREKRLSETKDLTKKAKPSKEDITSPSTVSRTGSTSAESSQDILTTLSESQGTSWEEPMDLTTELFGDSDSDAEKGPILSDFIKKIIAGEGEDGGDTTESDEVSYSQGVSFESALCGLGVAKTKRGVANKAKKHKKKVKVKGSADEDSVQIEGSDRKRNVPPAKLDLSVFNLKSPKVCLARTPTTTSHAGQGGRFFPLSPTTSSEPTTPDTAVSHTGAEASHSSQQSSEAVSGDTTLSKDTATCSSKKTIINPQYLPSGPLINLTKVAAAQHRKVSYTSLVAKHAAAKGKRKTTPKTTPTTQPKPTFSIIRRKEIALTAPLFYSHMKTYLLSEDQLRDNGYPRPTSRLGEATIHRGEASTSQANEIRTVGPNAMEHRCCRCGKRFIIYNSGQYQRVEECIYHYGRLFKNKEYGEGMVSKYTCCQGRRDSAGCQVAKFHVTAGERPTLDKGYVTTEAPPIDSTHQPCAYALDCEMCYTTAGLQLTRVSVINMSLQPVYENIVKPSHPIVDYNTRFSGLTSDDFIGVETSLEDVQADLLKLFFTDTILLGHSLESDLNSLKIIHSYVVDTAIVFPHRKGPPYKRALKTLMVEYMQKFIQDSIDGGHDSLEDSRACMELMLWKVKQDLKKVSRISITSEK